MGGVGTTERVRQRPHPGDVAGLAVRPQRRPAVAVKRRALADRRPVQQVGHVPLDVVELGLGQHTLEDVKPRPSVGVDDDGVDGAVGVETDWTTVAERQRPSRARFPIANHRRLGIAVVDDWHFE